MLQTAENEKWSWNKPYLLLSVIVAVQALIFLYTTWCGIAAEFDSLHYFSAAKSFAENGALKNPDGTVYTVWPPLYPLMLSLCGAKYIPAWTKFFQCICYCANTVILYKISFYLFEKKYTRIVFLLFTCFSTTLLVVHRFAWTEGLFILLLSLSFLCFYKSDYKISAYFFLSVIINNLLCMQRLAGIFFIIGFSICLFFLSEKKISFRSLMESGLYFSLSSISMVIWNYRNSFIEQEPSYLSNIGLSSYTHGIFFYAKGFTSWFMPAMFSNTLIEVVFSAAFVLYLLLILWQSHEKNLLKALAIIILVYMAIMIGINKDITEDFERYLSPVLIPVMIIVCTLGEKMIKTGSVKFAMLVKVLLLVSLSYACMRTIRNVHFGHAASCGSV